MNEHNGSAMRWMIYGANGYTGELIAREAARLGLKPVLAGRRRESIEPLAHELGLEARAFALLDVAALAEQIQGHALVLNCAGPFSATAAPGSLPARTHPLSGHHWRDRCVRVGPVTGHTCTGRRRGAVPWRGL